MALDADRIQKSVRKLRKDLKKLPKTPTPEQIHDLRTHTRRLEASLEAVSLDSKRNERQLLRHLRRVRRRAGRVRDMDVLTSHLSGIQIARDQDCLVQLFEYLGAERYRDAGRLHRIVQKNGEAIRQRLKRTSDRIEALEDGKNAAPNSSTEASAEAAASALSLSSDLANPKTLNQKNLHEYRLKVKELRYVLQMGQHQGNPDFIKLLGATKDAIGEWHDWEELIALATKVLQHGPSCPLLRELQAVSKRKYQLAVSVTNKMRKQYVLSKKGKLATKGKPRQRTLQAISSVAA